MNYAHTEFKKSAAGRNPVREGLPMLIAASIVIAAVIVLAVRCL